MTLASHLSLNSTIPAGTSPYIQKYETRLEECFSNTETGFATNRVGWL